MPRSLTTLDDARALPRAAWILFAGTFVNRFGSFVAVFLVLYVRRQGYSAADAGIALSAYGLGSLGASVAGGPLADRFGRRNAIAVSMFSSAATMVGLSQASTLGPLIALAALAGLTAELYRPASSALVADLTQAGERVTAFALYRLAINAGFAAGPVVAGLLAERSFLLVFVGDAVTSCVFGALALAYLPEGTRSRREAGEATALRTIASDRPFLLFLAASVAGALVYFQASSTFALQVVDHGHSKAVYGALMSINGIAIVAAELPLSAVTRRFPAPPVMALGSLLVGIGFGLTALAAGVAALAATVLVWTLGEIVFAPVASAFVADLSPERLRGRYAGAWSFTWSIAMVAGPAAGVIVYSWSHAAVWLACLGLGVVSAALVLAAGRASARRPA